MGFFRQIVSLKSLVEAQGPDLLHGSGQRSDPLPMLAPVLLITYLLPALLESFPSKQAAGLTTKTRQLAQPS